MKTVIRGLMRSKRVLSGLAWGGVGSAGSVEADGSTVVLGLDPSALDASSSTELFLKSLAVTILTRKLLP